MPYTGPTANLPGIARRQGRGGTVYRDAQMLGEVVAVDWDVEAEQVEVLIPGGWRSEMIAGAETRRGTLRMQDVDDRWKLEVWRFFEARRNGQFNAETPIFDLTTKIIGGRDETRWGLFGCQLFSYSGSYSNEDDLITRELPFSFRSDKPLHAFEYTSASTVAVTEK